jgi:hypothetical protein
VHALLHHLERVGFEAAPRVRGVDEKGREILTFVPGETGVPPDDEALVETARLVRRFHDAVSAFRPPPDARWQVMVGAPASGDLVCHNDLSPANTVTRSQRPIAFLARDAPLGYRLRCLAVRAAPIAGGAARSAGGRGRLRTLTSKNKRDETATRFEREAHPSRRLRSVQHSGPPQRAGVSTTTRLAGGPDAISRLAGV